MLPVAVVVAFLFLLSVWLKRAFGPAKPFLISESLVSITKKVVLTCPTWLSDVPPSWRTLDHKKIFFNIVVLHNNLI